MREGDSFTKDPGGAESFTPKMLKDAYDSRYLEKTDGMKIGRIAERKEYEKFLDILDAKKGQKILDVGCGYGNFLKVCEERGLESYGIDLSIVPLTKVALLQLRDSQLLVCDAERLPFVDDYFDYVCCFGTLEHFLNPDSGIKEIARVKKAGGKALITLSNSFFIGHIWMVYREGTTPTEGDQAFSEKYFTRIEWQNLIQQNGLVIDEVSKYNPPVPSRRVGSLLRFVYNVLARRFIPLNLSYQFVFICKKRTDEDAH